MDQRAEKGLSRELIVVESSDGPSNPSQTPNLVNERYINKYETKYYTFKRDNIKETTDITVYFI